MHNGMNARPQQWSHSGYGQPSTSPPSSSHHSELDGVKVKISEKYTPVTKVLLPLDYQSMKQRLDQLTYDFTLERDVIAQAAMDSSR